MGFWLPFGFNRADGVTKLPQQPAGSGGYGNPKERSVASIEADLLDGYITPQAARTLYGYQGSLE